MIANPFIPAPSGGTTGSPERLSAFVEGELAGEVADDDQDAVEESDSALTELGDLNEGSAMTDAEGADEGIGTEIEESLEVEAGVQGDAGITEEPPASLPPTFQRRMGPLEPAADAATIIERLWRRVGKEPPPTLASFPAILEDIADVGGSVVMAEAASVSIPPQDDTPRVDDGRWLIAHIQAQLDAMDRFIARRLAAPFGPHNGLPSVEKAQALLMSEVLSEDARERAVADLSRAFGQRLLALLRTVRRDANRIRADLAPELRRLGGRAAFLERLDASLRRATAHELAARDVVLGDLLSECAKAAMTEDFERADAEASAADAAAAADAAVADAVVEDAVVEDVAAEDEESADAITVDENVSALGATVAAKKPDLAWGALQIERWYRRGFVRSLRTEIDGLVRAFAAEERALLTHLANAAVQPVAGEAA